MAIYDAHLVADCPRCDAQKITFKVHGANNHYTRPARDDKARWYELLCVCGECNTSTIFKVSQSRNAATLSEIDWMQANFNIRDRANIEGVLSPADLATSPPPAHLPEKLAAAFEEGSKCITVNCYNAAGTMFRLCLDFATKELLPMEGEPNKQIRRSLGLRIEWLFNNNKLPIEFKDLAACVKDDGNDGAHEGILEKEAALDLEDFTRVLLERLYTLPARLIEAKKRREARHGIN